MTSSADLDRFHAEIAHLRPRLHRYCARMTGSVFDGEDVVQDTLAKAFYTLATREDRPPIEAWLFRIAHNTAVDFLRRYDRAHVDVVPVVPDVGELDERPPDPALVDAALAVFVGLPPGQRSALVLKDVLGYTLEEVADILDTTVPAVKSALVRARARAAPPAAASTGPVDERLRRYARLFDARDWDALRALITEETRLDVPYRTRRRGAAVGDYYGRYADLAPQEQITAVPGWVDGVEALGVFRAGVLVYFVQIVWDGEHVALLRDFRHVPTLTDGARFVPAG
jgi:RNA polymerase sigma-70 factor, ECF subfamily